MTADNHSCPQVPVSAFFIKVDVTFCQVSITYSPARWFHLRAGNYPAAHSEEAEITSEPKWIFTPGQLK